MQHLLNLLAAIALLVWGTHTVRTGILRVMGGSLRDALSSSVRKPVWAFASGVGVSSLLQSSTATCLIVSSFVGQGLFLTSTALIMMLGADVGTSLMALLFSFDMSWLSPLLIVVGVVTFVTNQNNTAGRWGRVAIGLGLMTLALRLIVEATRPITESQGMHVLLSVLPNDPLILMLVGAFLTVISYSSLAMVLLTATLCHTGVLSLSMALGLVLGANLGSGLLAFLTLSKSLPAVRRVPLGNLFFKVIGCMLALPFLSYFPPVAQELQALHLDPVVGFHVMFNLLLTVSLVGLTGKAGAWLALHLPATAVTEGAVQPKYLDPTALSTPSLAIACAAREALHQADVVETMLRGIMPVIQNDDTDLAAKLRKMDDGVDHLYSSIKFYLTQISREALSQREGQRWADIMSFAINMEQVGDIIERVLQDIEDKKIAKARTFSQAGLAEIEDLHQRLVTNLQLGMSVFLDGGVRNAQSLLEQKVQFRNLEHEYASRHLTRLQENTLQSIGTSSLHIDLISDLKRINSHICSIAYPILEQAGALASTRLKQPDLLTD
ncbi:MAG: Na/Pi cotransporter family protein [Limnohabitans sp.]|nr:Na/Pi cotransporter family protein [Burkholderiales bacterium]